MDLPWWKRSVVYQIYPRSFFDTDGDGVGDLRGITAKLDVLADLGVDCLWLCPVYDSPMDDNGYDIRDYRKIAPVFGTMADFDALLESVHERGMRLVMDLVVNHTSDEHAWFRASRSARDDPQRAFYIWRPPGPDGGPPNNWASLFGGSAWAFDETTGEYYLHLFSRKQPDLNWEHPPLREAIYEMVRWWLDKGIDGFRLDAVNLISKPPGLPDAPRTTSDRWQVPTHVFHGPKLLAFLGELDDRVFAGRDVLTVGEASGAGTVEGLELTHDVTGPLGMIHQFEHLRIDEDDASAAPRWFDRPWDLRELKRILTRWQRALGDHGWNANFLANHDLPRPVSRFGDDGEHRRASATLLATLVHLLQGTPFIYQGDEIGMTNVAFPSIEDYRDVETLQMYDAFVHERGMDSDVVMRAIHARSRDNARTPMQWNASEHAGFTTGEPWIGVHPNYPQINVERERADPESVWSYHRKLIELRRSHEVVVRGDYRLLAPDHRSVWAFLRTWDDERWLVLLNVQAAATRFEPPGEIRETTGEPLLGNLADVPVWEGGPFDLRPYEARVYRLREA